MARDLHDGVLQFLAGASLQLDAIGRESDLTASRSRLAVLRAALADEQRELRVFIAALNPVRAHCGRIDRSLSTELSELAERLARHWEVEVTSFADPVSLTLPTHLLFDVTRFIREGVANAVRHGVASKVRIVARASKSELRVEIGDNGRGFGFVGSCDHDEIASIRGPRSLHERARALGGTIQLASSSAGACITLAIPLDKV